MVVKTVLGTSISHSRVLSENATSATNNFLCCDAIYTQSNTKYWVSVYPTDILKHTRFLIERKQKGYIQELFAFLSVECGHLHHTLVLCQLETSSLHTEHTS